MARSKYRYNPESLSFYKIELSLKDKLLKFLAYFSVIAVISVISGIIIFPTFFDTPKEKKLKRENNQLALQYEIIDKKLNQIDKVLEDLEKRDDNIYRAMFEAEPLDKSQRLAGYGGANRYEKLEGYDNSEIVISVARKLDGLSKKMVVQSKSFDAIIALAKNKEKMIASVPAIMPISNKDLTRTASGWGMRIHPIYKIAKFHYGMDFTSPTGTEIYATGDGTVVQVKTSRRGYGNKIVIDHGFGYKTLYAHLNKFNVKRGQKVKRGDIIGFVGSTGTSTAPHLHYEVHKNGKKINPIYYYFEDLTAEEYDRMIEISANSGQTFD